MKHKRWFLLLPLALVLGLLCSLGTKATGGETSAQVVQTAVVEPTSERIDAAPGSVGEVQDYGQRQSLNPELSEFAGGHHDDEIIIIGVGSSGLLIAILVLVILL